MTRYLGARLAAAAAVAAVLATTTACGLLAREPAALLVGVALDLTGRQAAVGTVYHQAIQLQVEQLAAGGQLNDRRLELVVRDNRSDPRLAAEHLAELARDARMAAIITAGCPRCVSEAAPALAVPLITLDAADEVVQPVAERRWVFKLGPNAGDNADRLSQGMAADGARTVAVVATADPYGQAGAREMGDAAQRDGLRVVARHEIQAEEPASIAAAVDAIAALPADPADPAEPPDPAPAAPDAVVIWAPAPASIAIATALREAGYDGRFYLDTLAADPQFLPPAGRLGEATLVFTNLAAIDQRFVISPAGAKRRAWFSAYLSRHSAYHLQSSWAADALAVVVDAAARTGTGPAPAAIRDRLESTRIDGLTGQIRYTVDQHSGLHPTSLTLLTAGTDRWR
jgi:branched-chain amino acid transport system substrate-binding protein